MNIRPMAAGIVIAGMIAPISVGAVDDAGAASSSPSCGSISPAVVKSTLGITVSNPTSTKGSNSYYGFKETTLTCKYSGSSATAYLTYGTPATSADFNKIKKNLGGLSVSGLGNGAFKIVSYDNHHTAFYGLFVLVTGKAIASINAAKVTPSGEVSFMKKVIPVA